MKFTVLTLFPNVIKEYKDTSIRSNAISDNLVEIDVVDLRNFGKGKRRNVDDTVYGGGAGMVITVPVLDEALSSLNIDSDTKIIYLSPKGKTLNQNIVKDYSINTSHIVLICGHYEGVDERILELYDIEQVSIGDYILTGGELAALVLIDSITRLLPGVLSIGSAENETFENYLLEEEQYTKPLEYKGIKVPDILVSGNHKAVDEYRLEQRIYSTYKLRPDLLQKYIENNNLNENYIKDIITKKEGNKNGYN